MTQTQLATIDFHGKTLFVTDHAGEPFAPMKPIVEGMGLAWQSQQRKLSENKERWGIIILVIPTQSGVQQAVCMPLRKLPAFFASISANKVRPELRATILLFQNECDDALWQYWTARKNQPQIEASLTPQLALDAPLTPDQCRTIQNMVDALASKGMKHASVYARFKNHFRIARYDQLPQGRMSEAITYLMSLEPQKALPVPEPKALPAPEPTITDYLREYDEAEGRLNSIAKKISDMMTKYPEEYLERTPAQQAISAACIAMHAGTFAYKLLADACIRERSSLSR